MDKTTFNFEFEDESAASRGRKHDGITYEYSDAENEQFRFEVIAGAPTVLGNSAGLLALAKVLIKIALGRYKDGFHVHLHQDFNADFPEVLTVGLNGSIGNGAPAERVGNRIG